MEIKDSIFWNLIRIVWQKKNILIISFFASMIITFIVTSLMPKTYRASLTFIVNEESKGFNITSIISDLPFDIGGMGSSKVDKYIALLKSRAVRDTLISEFNLWEIYNEDYIEHVYKELNNNIEIIDNLDNTITLNCYYEGEPQKSYKMVNLLYDQLYRYSLKLNREKSQNYREFIEKSLNETYETLHQLEDSLKTFQEQNKIIEFDQQTKFSFQVLAELEAKKLLTKIEYDFLKSTATKNNPELLELKQKLNSIESNKERLYNEGEEYIIAFDKMPELGLSYFRLFRDITIQQEILKILLPIFHNAKIEEKKETVNIQIVDAAFVPQYKVKPKRLTYMVVITMLLLFFELFYFALVDAYKKNRNEINSWVSKG